MTNYLNICKDFSPFDHVNTDNLISRPLKFRQLIDHFRLMYSRSQQRQHLKSLEPHLLRDIGLTVQDAEFEASKPFWKE